MNTETISNGFFRWFKTKNLISQNGWNIQVTINLLSQALAASVSYIRLGKLSPANGEKETDRVNCCFIS